MERLGFLWPAVDLTEALSAKRLSNYFGYTQLRYAPYLVVKLSLLIASLIAGAKF